MIYPKEAFLYLILGICFTIIAFFMTQFKKKIVTRNKKDNRKFINEVWRHRVKVGDKVVGFVLVTLAIIAIFNFNIAISLLIPLLCLGFIVVGFIFIMHDDGEDELWEPAKSRIMRTIMRLIDYRTHPFSIPLILFILIVVTFLFSKQFGFSLSLEAGGNPKYVLSLPVAMYLQTGLIFTCGFIYCIQHEGFLGINQSNQSEYKLMAIHFMELIACSSTFFIWLITLFDALFHW